VSGGPNPARRAVVDVLLYTAARLVLVVALSAVIYGAARLLGVREFPIVVAVLFALIIAMPLGIWLFSPLRRRATAGLEVATERRRRDREQLRARLRGEAPKDDTAD
jgi:predicted permease